MEVEQIYEEGMLMMGHSLFDTKIMITQEESFKLFTTYGVIDRRIKEWLDERAIKYYFQVEPGYIRKEKDIPIMIYLNTTNIDMREFMIEFKMTWM